MAGLMRRFITPFTAALFFAAVIFNVNGIDLRKAGTPLVVAREEAAREAQGTVPQQRGVSLSLPVAHADEDPAAKHPARLKIPSIALDSRVIGVGVDKKGRMDVPSGKTKDVGWYQYGTLPGERGSAVLDAHVYAAFKNLRNVKVGNDIYVTAQGGRELHFKVTETVLYPYDKVPPYELFERADGKRLNLITCAGKWNRSLGTYTERLVVYAVLVE